MNDPRDAPAGAGATDPARTERFAVRRPVTVAMIFLATAVFGWQSFLKIPRNLMPDIAYPTLTVRTELEGSAPEEVEDLVSKPLEEALGTANNLVQVSSISSAGLSEVILEFTWKTNMDFAVLDLRGKLDRVVLPEEATRPIILRYNPNLDPVLRFAVFGAADLYELREVAEEEIKRELEGITGVASAQVDGGLEEEIVVQIEEARAAQLGIDVNAIALRLAQENINLAGGQLKEGKVEYLVRTRNEFVDPVEMEQIVVGGDPRAGSVRLRDVATVQRTHRERKTITRIGGEEAVLVSIFKEADANTVTVVRAVRERLAAMFAGPRAAPRAADASKAAMVRARDLSANIPAGVGYRTISDQAKFIESALDEVQSNAVFGGVLALLILMVFLRDARSTVIIGLSIPISIAITFVPMFAFGVSLNVMSLGGLALGVGMLVDNGIVVVENIFRLRQEGLTLREAADRGASEVAGAITSSTLTTVAVFFPIVFVEGVAGQIFGDFALAVAFSLLGSLMTALFLIPMLASRERLFEAAAAMERDPIWLRRAAAEGSGPRATVAGAGAFVRDRYRTTTFVPFADRAVAARVLLAPVAAVVWAWRALLFGAELVVRAVGAVLGALLLGVAWALGAARAGSGRLLARLFGPPLRLFGSAFDALERRYPALLRACLRRRATVLVSVALLFGGSLALFPTLGQELIPRMHQGEFGVILEKPIGTPLDVTAASVLPAEQLLAREPSVDTLFAEIGASGTTGTQQRELQGEHRAELTVRLGGTDENVYREEAAIARVRAALRAMGGMTMKIVEPSIFSFKTPVEIEVEGRDLETLKRLGRDVQRILERIDGLADVQTSLQEGSPEVHVVFDDERMSHYGLSLSQAAEALRDKILGTVPTKFTKGERKIDIRVRARTEELGSIDALRDLTIGYVRGQAVPLRAVSDISIEPGPSEIRRVGQRRVAVVSANVQGRDLGSVSEEIRAVVGAAAKRWPAGYGFAMGGQEREWETSYRSLQLAFALAIFLVYIVMASQFESFFEPFVIMFAVPLASIGVVLAMKAFALNVSVISLIGVIMLAGIVVNNAIVLVDRIKQVRAEGLPLGRALDTAGRQRLRPILMTTTTTVLGLLPMAVSVGDGAEIRAPMAIVVIAGLAVSTILTLFVVPIIYSYMTRRTSPEDLLDEEAETASAGVPAVESAP